MCLREKLYTSLVEVSFWQQRQKCAFVKTSNTKLNYCRVEDEALSVQFRLEDEGAGVFSK